MCPILRFMPQVEKNAPGVFCWMELATSDQGGAKLFYTSLFGWTAQDNPMGPGEIYTMFQLAGKNAGAAYSMRPEESSGGVPPHWNLYIAVTNADQAAQSATELGA